MLWRREKSGKPVKPVVRPTGWDLLLRRALIGESKRTRTKCMHACMHAQGMDTGRQRFPALPSVTLIYCRSSGTHNGLSSSLRVPGLIAKADEKSPHYVFQIKDCAFSEAKHSATRNKGCNLKGRSEVLKQDKYYKHRVYMMCVIQNYKKQDTLFFFYKNV